MAKADQLKARAEALRKKAQDRDQSGPAPDAEPVLADEPAAASPRPDRPRSSTSSSRRSSTSSEAPPLAKPVRSTVDLPPVLHANLKAWLGESAVQLGRSRITTQDVVRTMVRRLLTDETFARKIRDDLRKELQ